MSTADSQPSSTRRGRLLRWLHDRTGLPGALGSCPVRAASGRPGWWSLWISGILGALVIQVFTGFFLWTYYSASSQTAWESVYYIQHEVLGGWLLRGLHFWTAQVLVALLGLYVIQMIVRGAYRAPREFVFWTALVLALLALGLCLTGDLLRWDQNGYAATKTRVDFLMLLPWIGEPLWRLAVGGLDFGHLTLTRFLALHVACFAGSFILFFLAHLWVARRAVLSSEAPGEGKAAASVCCACPSAHGLACLGLLIVVLLLVFAGAFAGSRAGQPMGEYLGADLGAPADRDPGNPYSAARPEWSFRGLYGFSNAFPGAWKILPIFVFSTIFLALVFLMPVFAHRPLGHQLNLLVLAVLAAGMGYFTYTSYAHDRDNTDYHKDLAAGEEEAHRAKELIRGLNGIPPTGALNLLRSDPKTQGPKLWKQQCAVCHDYTDPSGKVLATEKPSAPDLAGFASRPWIAGFLDPKQIQGPKHFGNTRFAAGVMVRYVQGQFAKIRADDRAAVIAALSAEARLASQAEQEVQDKPLIEKGRKLLADANQCARCHRFHDAGKPGYAPDLTGYGSREWILGVLADPTHSSFYGLRNDRMPTYVEAPAQPEKNRLLADQVGLVTDWLRGEWYEPGAAEADPEKPEDAKPPKAPVLLALGTWEARRVKQEAPPADRPAAQARFLFKQEHCALCHPFTGTPHGDIVPEHPSAPDLGGHASRQWFTGLFDPKQVDGPKYFGRSAFKKGKMVEFVKNEVREFDAATRKDLEKLIAALAAEAQRDGQPAPPAAVKEAVSLADTLGCTDCHKFYNKGKAGSAPDLTGYGSREWLTAVIGDPASPRFYGKRNDGMPSYRMFGDEEARKNLLGKQEIVHLADWLRGK